MCPHPSHRRNLASFTGFATARIQPPWIPVALAKPSARGAAAHMHECQWQHCCNLASELVHRRNLILVPCVLVGRTIVILCCPCSLAVANASKSPNYMANLRPAGQGLEAAFTLRAEAGCRKPRLRSSSFLYNAASMR